jgi:hypothetical protein
MAWTVADVDRHLAHQCRCILRELEAARALADRLDRDPALIAGPYLDQLRRLLQEDAELRESLQVVPATGQP